MNAMLELIVSAAILLVVTIDPIGTLALFAGVTAHLPARERRRTALLSTLYAAAILVGAVAIGQPLLDAIGVKLVSIRVAGGVILFLFGIQMIFGQVGGASAKAESGRDLAVFPLAVPSIASPGAILAAIMLTENDQHPLIEQVAVSLVLLGVLGVTLLGMLLATPILRVIGQGGAALLMRVLGMLLAGLAVEIVLTALGVAGWTE